MKQYKFLLLIIMVFCFGSCGTVKQLTPEQRLYFEHSANVDKSINNGDVLALIEQHDKFDDCKSYIEVYLESTHDFANASYSTLNMYKETAKDSTLVEIFDRLIEYKEDDIISELMTLSIDEIGEYYRNHVDEQCFVRPIIDSLFIQNIGKSDYREVRLLRNSFYNTDIFESVDSTYQRMRMEYLPIVEESVLNYCKEEIESVNLIKKDILSRTTAILIDGLPLIVEETSNKINRDFFDKIFSANTSDDYSIKEYAIMLVNKKYDVDSIQILIKEPLYELVKSINNSRNSILDYYLDAPIAESQYSINFRNNPVKYYAPPFPAKHILAIQEIKDKIDWKSWGLMALGFIPGIGTGASLVIDAVDILYGLFADNKETKMINSHLEQYASELALAYNNKNTQNIEMIFNNISNELIKSQNEFKRLFYENF